MDINYSSILEQNGECDRPVLLLEKGIMLMRKLTYIFGMICLHLGLTACQFPIRLYHQNIEQGNHLKSSAVAKLKPGMTIFEVESLLGGQTLLETPFSDADPAYVYYFISGETGACQSQRLLLKCKKGRLVEFQFTEGDLLPGP